ncbi:MAG TPA: tetratricopeptide repeat protein [Tepidisphaeraceae bacterium]|jgi:tetratricopeptide (TPR) repeat protein
MGIETSPTQPDVQEPAEAVDVPSLIRGKYVALVGRPASMTRAEFFDLLEANGGRPARRVGRGVSVVVVGQRDWPVGEDGMLPQPLRDARHLIRRERSPMRILSEAQFLSALGLESYRENTSRLYTLSTLAEALGVGRERVRAWVAAGLVRPVKVEFGVWYFDFRQSLAARQLSSLFRSGVSLRRLRLTLEQLRRWLPEAQEPLEQLAVLEDRGELLVRLEDGDLSAADGQLHFDFEPHENGEPAAPMRIVTGPRTAAEWLDQGLEQEQAGYVKEAVESYRQSLRVGGPNKWCCLNLANALWGLGKRDAALERCRQAVEIDGEYVDAWVNLGAWLGELERHEEACAALRHALAVDPDDLRARYNLARSLEELGREQEALAHWRAYLRQDQTSRWAAYARRRLEGAG